MRARWVAIAVLVVLVAAGVAWWLWPSGADGPVTPTEPVAEPLPLTSEFVKAKHPEEEVHDAGFLSVDGEVIDGDEKPVPGALVEAWSLDSLPANELECSACGMAISDCMWFETVTKVLDGLRTGTLRPPKPFATTTTDARGTFHFDSLPGEYLLVASKAGARGLARFDTVDDDGLVSVTLRDPLEVTVLVEGPRAEPVAGARVTMFSFDTFELQETTSDAQGIARFKTSEWDNAWVGAEAPGLLPAASRGVLTPEGGGSVILAPPRTLVVKTLSGSQPVDTDVKIFLHGTERTLRTHGGELKLEKIPYGTYDLEVTGEKLAAPRQSVELLEPVTEVVFDLRRSARLLLATVSAKGQPVPMVSAELSGNDVYAHAAMNEEGEVLIVGPVPEGEYQLDVQAPGFRPIARTIDLAPGDKHLELVLREASRLRGRVVTPDGRPAPEDTQLTVISSGFAHVYARLEDGGFEADVPVDGEWSISARHPDHGSASVTLEVPGPEVTLRLASRAQVEVEVRDFDGTSSPQEVSLQHVATGETVFAVPRENGVSRVAGLEPGAYTLTLSVPQRRTIEQKLEVPEGRTTRVSLKLDKGATVSGVVLDEKGQPSPNATIIAVEHSTSAGPDGRFSLEGLDPGQVSLIALLSTGPETPETKVNAPAHDVVLRAVAPKMVSGRVVDDGGRVITSFTANAAPVNSPDGRFSVALQSGYLTVWADGYSTWEQQVDKPGEVGDVVLKKLPTIEGDVVDPEGRPVAGARVMLVDVTAETTTNGSGHFKLAPDTGEPLKEPLEVNAVRGALFGKATVTRGYARIELSRGTHLVGKVVDEQGRPVQTEVKLESRTVMRPLELESDARGVFEADLAPGPWMIGTRQQGGARTYDVRGERFEVTIGVQAGTCGLVMRAAQPFESAWLMPAGVALAVEANPWTEAARTPGIFEIPGGRPGVPQRVRGVPCGEYELLVVFVYGERKVHVSLGSGDTVVDVAAPEVETPDGGTLLIVH